MLEGSDALTSTMYLAASDQSTNVVGSFVGAIIWLTVITAMYFIPTFVALGRHHQQGTVSVIPPASRRFRLTPWVIDQFVAVAVGRVAIGRETRADYDPVRSQSEEQAWSPTFPVPRSSRDRSTTATSVAPGL